LPRIYLDHNATTPLHPQVRVAMNEALDRFGNPSSLHAEGRRARDAVEQAREQVAALVGAGTDEIVFTSGGTESCNLGIAACEGPVATTRLEHPAVLEALAGRARFVTPGSDGRIDIEDMARALRGAASCSVQWVNHELGNINPVEQLADCCRSAGVLFHSDAVQAAGKLAIDVARARIDLLSISAHKIFGPKGVGALVVRRDHPLALLLRGGHQEKGRRPGTENVIGIVGMGVACERALHELSERHEKVLLLSHRLEEGLVSMGADIHGDRDRRVPGTISAGFEGVPGDALAQSLDLEGVSVSTGAACTSGSIAPSGVLLAMGVTEERARSAVRFSLGPGNSVEQIDRVLAILPGLIQRIRQHAQ
jgi:cysteine desulfurase